MNLQKALGLASIAIMVGSIFLQSNVLAEGPVEGMTQSDFAMWLVEQAEAQDKLPPAALGDDAMDFLSALGIEPDGGWSADKAITSGDLAHMAGVPAGEASNLSFAQLADAVTDLVTSTIGQVSGTSGGDVSPTISPGA